MHAQRKIDTDGRDAFVPPAVLIEDEIGTESPNP